jgi:aspartate/methionine/tyrosine aminotransferase
MPITPFKLERYFAKYEFSTRYLLSSSDCDGLPMHDLLGLADAECRKLWDNLALGYTESLGHPLLREEIANLYEGVSMQDVLLIVPEEGIYMAMQSILQPGDHVICTFPGYQSLYQIAADKGCEVTQWRPEEDQGWRFNPDFLEESLRPNTRLLVFNFPHNPTGSLPSKEDYARILDFARAHSLSVFSDEMYRLLELDPQDRLPSACECYEKAVSLFGMSKTFGMAGVRQGWLVTRDPILFDQLAAYKDYTTICGSAPSEVLSLIALRNRMSITAEHLARIRRNLGLLDEFFAQHNNLFSWNRPRAGTIAFPRLNVPQGAMAFCQKLVDEAGIMLLPATVYDYDDQHVRVGFGRENLPAGITALEEYIKKMVLIRN